MKRTGLYQPADCPLCKTRGSKLAYPHTGAHCRAMAGESYSVMHEKHLLEAKPGDIPPGPDEMWGKPG